MKTEAILESLLDYAQQEKLIEKEDRNWARNALLETLRLEDYSLDLAKTAENQGKSLQDLLDELSKDAHQRGIIEDLSVTRRDLFDTALMGRLTPRPSWVISRFREKYNQNPEAATDWFYDFSRKTNYIREERIKKDEKWFVESEYGPIEISINLSKPEKDPKEIAAAGKQTSSSYPECALCIENEGYFGRLNHPARQNHRIIPVHLGQEQWFLQYSPYIYYNEHCILLNQNHHPMKIDRQCFINLLEFNRQFPHYFIGSNADLPIVGGSILSHEHFQGGRHDFAMAKAPEKIPFKFEGFEDISAGIVKWPLSVLRLRSDSPERLADLAEKILTSWRNYTDPDSGIFSHSNGEEHNTITPIVRRNKSQYELDLVFRNNLTSDEYPDGIFHPHPEIHHIKKENIGLIEVMGLAILPGRLKNELEAIASFLQKPEDSLPEGLKKHEKWIKELKEQYSFEKMEKEPILDLLKEKTGLKFLEGLKHCGVFKDDEEGEREFIRFLKSVNNTNQIRERS